MNEQRCLTGHVWEYETPNGKTSRAKCKYCPATREDVNAYPYNTKDYPLENIKIKYSPMNNIDSLLESSRHGKQMKRDFNY
jgi:hypothetical protein